MILVTLSCTTHSSCRTLCDLAGTSGVMLSFYTPPLTWPLAKGCHDRHQTAKYPRSMRLCAVCPFPSVFKVQTEQQHYHGDSVKLQTPAASTSEGEGMSKQHMALPCQSHSCKWSSLPGQRHWQNCWSLDPSHTPALYVKVVGWSILSKIWTLHVYFPCNVELCL